MGFTEPLEKLGKSNEGGLILAEFRGGSVRAHLDAN